MKTTDRRQCPGCYSGVLEDWQFQCEKCDESIDADITFECLRQDSANRRRKAQTVLAKILAKDPGLVAMRLVFDLSNYDPLEQEMLRAFLNYRKQVANDSKGLVAAWHVTGSRFILAGEDLPPDTDLDLLILAGEKNYEVLTRMGFDDCQGSGCHGNGFSLKYRRLNIIGIPGAAEHEAWLAATVWCRYFRIRSRDARVAIFERAVQDSWKRYEDL